MRQPQSLTIANAKVQRQEELPIQAPTSLVSVIFVSRSGDPLVLASLISAFLSLVSSDEELEEVLRRLCEPRPFPSENLLLRLWSLPPSRLRLLLLDGLLRRRRGGVTLLLVLLLLVSRRSSRLRPPRVSESMISFSSEYVARFRFGAGLLDLDGDLVSERCRPFRDRGGGERLTDTDARLLVGRGDRETEASKTLELLRRVLRSGLLGLPLPL